MRRRRKAALGIFAALAVGFASHAIAQGTSVTPGPRLGSEVIEGVAAIVGDEPVLRSEVEEQYQLLSAQFQIDRNDSSQANQLRREILDNLVNERLLTMEAELLGIEVDEAQIDQAVEEGIRGDREQLGDDGFVSQLQAEGLTEADLRAIYARDLRNDFLRRQLVQREVFSKVSINDSQVRRRFEEDREKIGKRPRALRVLDLFIRSKPDSMIEKTYRDRAAEIRAEIIAGLAFEEAAQRYSDDERSRERGGLLGRFAVGDLGDRSFEQVAFDLPIGEVSQPVRTNLGYHIVKVVDRDPNGAWTQVRHILVGVAASRSDDQRTRQRVEAIRSRIIDQGLDFAEAVRLYSEDPASREVGGDVGWLPIDNFLGETRAAVENLRVGEVSGVAAVEGGFHVFKLIGEQAETDYSFDEIRDELRNLVEMEERQKRLDQYLAELRAKTFVEVRSLQ